MYGFVGAGPLDSEPSRHLARLQIYLIFRYIVIYPILSWLEDMGYAQVEPDKSSRKRARLTAEGAAFLAANRDAADDLLARKPPAFHRGNAPKEIVAAMDEIKIALRRRMAAEGADETLIATLAAQLRDTARAIAGDTPDAPPDES